MQTAKESKRLRLRDVVKLFDDDVRFSTSMGAGAPRSPWRCPEQATPYVANRSGCFSERSFADGYGARGDLDQSGPAPVVGPPPIQVEEPKAADEVGPLRVLTDDEWSDGPDDALTVAINDWIDEQDLFPHCPSRLSLDETSTVIHEPEFSCLTGFIRIPKGFSKDLKKRHYSEVEDDDEMALPCFKKLRGQSLSQGGAGFSGQGSLRESPISLSSSSESSTSPWSTRQSSPCPSSTRQSSPSPTSTRPSSFLSSVKDENEADDNSSSTSSAWSGLWGQGLISSVSDFSDDEEVQSILNPSLWETTSKRHFQHFEVDDDELSTPSAKRHKRSRSC